MHSAPGSAPLPTIVEKSLDVTDRCIGGITAATRATLRGAGLLGSKVIAGTVAAVHGAYHGVRRVISRPDPAASSSRDVFSSVDSAITRREFLRSTVGVAVVAAMLSGVPPLIRAVSPSGKSIDVSWSKEATTLRARDLKKKPADLQYRDINPETKMERLFLFGGTSRTVGAVQEEGKVIRSLRYKRITDAVERRYGLPKHLLLAMMIQEAGGVDMLPNSGDDGGLGLIHMQPMLAVEYGLSTYKGCKELVCREHGREVRALIEQKNFDLKQLVGYDDRFNPVLNIDAAGRLMALAIHRAGARSDEEKIRSGVLQYSGSYNFPRYLPKVQKYRELLSDDRYIRDLEQHFNTANAEGGGTIDGRPATLHDYLNAHAMQHENYGLVEYLGLPRVRVQR